VTRGPERGLFSCRSLLWGADCRPPSRATSPSAQPVVGLPLDVMVHAEPACGERQVEWVDEVPGQVVLECPGTAREPDSLDLEDAHPGEDGAREAGVDLRTTLFRKNRRLVFFQGDGEGCTARK